jgi:hypothetical protein
MKLKSDNVFGGNFPPMPKPQSVLYARTPNGDCVIGVVTDAEPSSLSLLAAGVAGMAARRIPRKRLKK